MNVVLTRTPASTARYTLSWFCSWVKSAVAGSVGVLNVSLQQKREVQSDAICGSWLTYSANPSGDPVLFWKSTEAKLIPPDVTSGTPGTD